LTAIEDAILYPSVLNPYTAVDDSPALKVNESPC
jgi:hypothetical protein